MKLLLVGAGRMGLRHLAGLAELQGEIHVVDPRAEAATDVDRIAKACGAKAKIHFHSSLDIVPFGTLEFDCAVLSETAHGRLERLGHVASHGIKNILIEKPIEQSRKRLREIRDLANNNGLQVRCNHWPRTLPFFDAVRERGGPFQITVLGGAYGLGCNGIHWIDLAFYLTKSRGARMLFGDVEVTRIDSGRGSSFRDYGGRAEFGFEDGSRLFLNSSAESSAPTIVTIIQRTGHYVIDHEQGLIIAYDRDSASTKPNYLYGADYIRRELPGAAGIELSTLTRGWLRSISASGDCPLPTLEEAALGHELLFDLLETTGAREFAIT